MPLPLLDYGDICHYPGFKVSHPLKAACVRERVKRAWKARVRPCEHAAAVRSGQI